MSGKLQKVSNGKKKKKKQTSIATSVKQMPTLYSQAGRQFQFYSNLHSPSAELWIRWQWRHFLLNAICYMDGVLVYIECHTFFQIYCSYQ